MRSYHYNEGVWVPIADPLPREADKTRDVIRDSAPSPDRSSVLAPYEKYNALDLQYMNALRQMGFTGNKRTLECHLAVVEVYARSHVDIKPDRKDAKEYDFLCVLRFAGSYIRVWITDLPNLFLFLREIEAHEENRVDTSVSDSLEKIFYDEGLQSLIINLQWLAEHLQENKLVVGVKSAPQQKK